MNPRTTGSTGGALHLLVPDAELEVRVGAPILVEDAGGYLPAVEVRMPPYMAARLAHLLDQWASVCDLTGSDEGIEWVAAAHALLKAARTASPERDDPEFADLTGIPYQHRVGVHRDAT
jgi:hypothetical protein